MRSHELHQAIIRTIAYSLVFKAPLKDWQVQAYLLSPNFFPAKRIVDDWHQIDSLIGQSEFSQNLVEFSIDDYGEVKKQKWRGVAQAISWFKIIPWISSVWVTGSLAVDSVKESDDLDFMIITDNHRLWITRILISLMGVFNQKLRLHNYHDYQAQDHWCCNLWLEQSAISLENENSLYIAREIVQARPVYQRSSGEALKFVAANEWVRNYSLRGWIILKHRAKNLVARPLFISYSLGKIIDFGLRAVNKLAYKLQRWYMKPRQKNEKVSISKAFFHPLDRAKIVEDEYERILSVLQQII